MCKLRLWTHYKHHMSITPQKTHDGVVWCVRWHCGTINIDSISVSFTDTEIILHPAVVEGSGGRSGLETDLSFSSHVKAVTKSAYYHLKNIARIRCFVSSHDLEKLVHAFITSRVDYCNGLLTGLPKKTIRQLQLIQNAAARILTRTRKSEHITPVLRSLHWLPVTFRIDFKVLLLVYKSLNGLGPKYMSDMLTEYKPNRPLRSLGSSQLEIPRVHTNQGESAFSYYAARSWNQLPEEIRCAKTLATFKSSLKTHLFSCAFVEWALCYVRTDCIVFYV